MIHIVMMKLKLTIRVVCLWHKPCHHQSFHHIIILSSSSSKSSYHHLTQAFVIINRSIISSSSTKSSYHHHHHYKLIAKCDNPGCLLVVPLCERQIEKSNTSCLQLYIFIIIFITVIMMIMIINITIIIHHCKRQRLIKKTLIEYNIRLNEKMHVLAFQDPIKFDHPDTGIWLACGYWYSKHQLMMMMMMKEWKGYPSIDENAGHEKKLWERWYKRGFGKRCKKNDDDDWIILAGNWNQCF